MKGFYNACFAVCSKLACLLSLHWTKRVEYSQILQHRSPVCACTRTDHVMFDNIGIDHGSFIMTVVATS